MLLRRKIFFGLAAGLIVAAVVVGLNYRHWHTVPILMYHSFEAQSSRDPLLTVSVANFDRQMAFLKRFGYRVVPVQELVQATIRGERLPLNSVAITIDDGLKDNYTQGLPVLKKYGFPAMIFLATGYMDKDPDYLTWAQVREMTKSNISFGGHTRHHVYLPSIADTARLRDEIAGSKADIEEHIGVPVEVFAYPTGGYTPGVQQITRDSGYSAAMTTNRSFDRLNRKDMYALRRVTVRDNDNELIMLAKVSGFYNFFRKGKPGY